MSYSVFRAKYPLASLISELVQVEQGLFVVRCFVQENKQTYATGLAADKSIEVAEDRARDRVFRLLNLDYSIEDTSQDYQSTLDTLREKSNHYPSEIGNVKEFKDSIAQHLESDFVVPPQEKIIPVKNPEEIVFGVSQAKSEDTIEDSEEEEITQPLDFSDVIAKTNRELKRIDWTTQQGKEHLMQTYGKRSRQLLSDDELLDFLKFLETQPTSGDNPF